MTTFTANKQRGEMGTTNVTHSVASGACGTFCLAVVSLFTLCEQYSCRAEGGKNKHQWIFFFYKLNSPFKNQCVFCLVEFNSGNMVTLFYINRKSLPARLPLMIPCHIKWSFHIYQIKSKIRNLKVI